MVSGLRAGIGCSRDAPTRCLLLSDHSNVVIALEQHSTPQATDTLV